MSVVKFGAQRPAGYCMVAKADQSAEIFLYGIIGLSKDNFFGVDGITALEFAKDLRALGKDVTKIDIRINSDGGYVTDGRAIYSLLNDHKANIHVHVDGIAASIASVIAMAGDKISISEGGYVMIHNARMGQYGGVEDMLRAAEELRMTNESIRGTYVARTKKDAQKVKKWMDAETWFLGPEAVQNGFADELVADKQMAACLQFPSAFRNVPNSLLPKRAAAIARMASLRRATAAA